MLRAPTRPPGHRQRAYVARYLLRCRGSACSSPARRSPGVRGLEVPHIDKQHGLGTSAAPVSHSHRRRICCPSPPGSAARPLRRLGALGLLRTDRPRAWTGPHRSPETKRTASSPRSPASPPLPREQLAPSVLCSPPESAELGGPCSTLPGAACRKSEHLHTLPSPVVALQGSPMLAFGSPPVCSLLGRLLPVVPRAFTTEHLQPRLATYARCARTPALT